MKVKISYTTDLENVPAEMDQLILRAEKNLETALSICSNLKEIKDRSMEKALNRMEDVRFHMMESDIILEDCSAIASGYLRAITSSDEGQDPPQEAPLDAK